MSRRATTQFLADQEQPLLRKRKGLIAAVIDTSRAKDLGEYVLHPVEVTNDKRNMAESFHHG
jgi:hypothetical protein